MEMAILGPLLLVGLLGLGFVLIAFRSPRSNDHLEPSRSATGRALYQQRRQELDVELAGGLLSEASHAEAVNELGLALLDDQGGQVDADSKTTDDQVTASARGWRVAFALLFVAGVSYVYTQLGEPQIDALRETAGILQQQDVGPTQLAAWQRTLQQRTSSRPGDQQSWYLLGHVRLRGQDFASAATAFGQAYAVAAAEGQPIDINLDLYWLQARYLAARGELDETSKQIVERVLEKAPNHPFVLEILAMDALRVGDYQQAVSVLNRALSGRLSPAQRATLQVGLTKARERMEAPGTGVDVRIEGLATAPASATLFIIARPVGGGMPFAVVRRPGPDYPEKVRLDDAVSMNPANPLSVAGKFEVLVRLSRSGGVRAQPEDWQWRSEPLELDASQTEGISLVAMLAPPTASSVSPSASPHGGFAHPPAAGASPH